MKKKDNGFTLIELIVVIAIIAVLSGVILISINPIQATAAKQAASAIEEAILTQKQNSMTKATGQVSINNSLILHLNDKGKVTALWSYPAGRKKDSSKVGTSEEEVLSNRKVAVTVSNGKDNEYSLGDNYTNSLMICFDKGSGACTVFGPSGAAEKLPATNKRVITVSAGGTSYKITVSGVTGRVDKERVN